MTFLDNFVFEDFVHKIVYYYVWFFSLVGLSILGLCVYRIYSTVRWHAVHPVFKKYKFMVSLFIGYVFIKMYIVLTIFIAYMSLMRSDLQEVNTWFPLNMLAAQLQEWKDLVEFKMLLNGIGGIIFVISVIILLNGLVYVLKTRKQRIQGVGVMTLALLVSFVGALCFV